jgi:hypothetical protein
MEMKKQNTPAGKPMERHPNARHAIHSIVTTSLFI